MLTLRLYLRFIILDDSRIVERFALFFFLFLLFFFCFLLVGSGPFLSQFILLGLAYLVLPSHHTLDGINTKGVGMGHRTVETVVDMAVLHGNGHDGVVASELSVDVLLYHQ